jgi:peptide/nickel transport system substrate-binding protein
MMVVALFSGCGQTAAPTTAAPTTAGPTTAAPTTGAPNTDDQVLRLRKAASLQSCDWEATTNTLDMQIMWVQVFEGLYTIDEADGGYKNMLAKEIVVSEDGLTYTATLVDAVFQNGDPLKASDVVFSYDRAMKNSRFNYVTSMINKIEAKDDKTVVFTLDYPYSAISHTFWSIKISSEREVTERGAAFGTTIHTAGTGPYTLSEYDVASGVKLVANENYWRGAPDIKKVEYIVISDNAAAVIAFENGEIDYLPDAPLSEWDSLVRAAGDNHSLTKGNNIRFLAINYLSPTNNNILGNQKVREAIFYAINRDNIRLAATSGYGAVAYEYMPHEYVATSPSVEDGKFKKYDYDPNKAKELLKEAGFTDAQIAAGIDVGTLMTYGATTAERAKAAQVIQASLLEVGIKCEVYVAEAAQVTPKLYTQDYDMCIFGDSGNYDFNNIRQQVHSESTGMYVVKYADDKSPVDWERLEELVDLGVSTADVAERYEYYTELWTIVMDSATIMPLFHNPVGIVWSSKLDPGGLSPTYYHIYNFKWVK